VIVVTLVIQGAALVRIVEWLGLGRVGAREAVNNRRDEHKARIAGVDAVLALLDQTEKTMGTPARTLEALRRLELERRASFASNAEKDLVDLPATEVKALRLQLIDAERAAIGAAYEDNRITDEARRRIERELDLQEASIRHGITTSETAPG
jgi:CPA1 family monovalent cation:H+ antiporter